jgi:hypothetical protein
MQILQEQTICPCSRPFGRNDLKNQAVQNITLTSYNHDNNSRPVIPLFCTHGLNPILINNALINGLCTAT